MNELLSKLNEVKVILEEVSNCSILLDEIEMKIYDNENYDDLIEDIIVEIKNHELDELVESSINLVCSLRK